MAYPNHNISFHIYTDASNYQMWAIISKKLTNTQQNCHTMEKEILSIVMVLETFCSMHLDAKLFIYIDHKNHTFVNVNCCRIFCWQLFIEEFG
ncbi:hypothetical protein ACHAXS_000552, partial [Conticribra weissflogii]